MTSLIIKYVIEDSNINIRMIDNKIKLYQILINHLEENLSSLKKLIEYNKKMRND